MEIFEGLLQHGRLSMNQIMDRHKGMHKALTSNENTTAADVLHENFSKLAEARYIERCPAHSPFLKTEKEDGAKKKTPKSKVTNSEKEKELYNCDSDRLILCLNLNLDFKKLILNLQSYLRWLMHHRPWKHVH